MNAKQLRIAQLCVRLALGFTFLSAVADRFGLWGPNGSKNVAWGDWRHFLLYAATLNWYLPAAFQAPAAIAATIAEVTFGVALIAGLYLRTAAYGSACLLALFALSMMFARGIKAPLDYSVFVDAAAAFLLAATIHPRGEA